MFDWFAELLYKISMGLMELIDGILQCANKLCGIESITVDGKETDFLTMIFRSDEINYAFRVSVLLATIVVVFFAIFAIIKNVAKEQSNETPTKIAIKAAKAILTFLLVPGCMLVFMWLLNVFMQALYQGTLHNASSIGQYLFSAFADGAFHNGHTVDDVLREGFDYTDMDQVNEMIDIWDFNFIFSWIGCLAILCCLAICMIAFIERAISIVILYIAAPFSIASTVLDDGSRFKLWRDQILVKFINGYGMIIAINIYALIMGLVCRSDVEFFDSSFLNAIMKITVILGGAYALQKITAVIGNLIQAGAGSNEARENMAAAMSTGRMLGGAALSPLKAGRGLYNFGRDWKKFGLGTTLASNLGLRNKKDYMRYNMEKNLGSKDNSQAGEGSGNKNENKSSYNNENQSNGVSNAIQGGDNNNNNNNNNSNLNNNNNNNNNSTGQNMVNNALSGDDEDYK